MWLVGDPVEAGEGGDQGEGGQVGGGEGFCPTDIQHISASRLLPVILTETRMDLDKVTHSLGIVNKVAPVTLGVFRSAKSLHSGVDDVGYSHVKCLLDTDITVTVLFLLYQF